MAWCNGFATTSAHPGVRGERNPRPQHGRQWRRYFVPAFSGLYAPHWKEQARGVICGLTRFATKAHIARAALEATAFQTREGLDAMVKDSRIAITELRVDGGMVVNETLMQFQADTLNVPVVRPEVIETTALRAAYAAGLAAGYWRSADDIVENWSANKRWHPAWIGPRATTCIRFWQKAVTRSLDWAGWAGARRPPAALLGRGSATRSQAGLAR